MSQNHNAASVWDMVQAIQKIETFTENMNLEDYLEDFRTISAVERQFEILGEAARRISMEFRQTHSNMGCYSRRVKYSSPQTRGNLATPN